MAGQDITGEGQEDQQERVNLLGGLPKPGSGWHPKEAHYWDTPSYEIHPITLNPEAVEGIFFRLWPEHVKVLQAMKDKGWPSSEIVKVGVQLHERQNQQHEKDKELVQGHKDAQHQLHMGEAANVYQDVGIPQDEKGDGPAEKALPQDDQDYRRAVRSFRDMHRGQPRQSARRRSPPKVHRGVLRKAQQRKGKFVLPDLPYHYAALEPHLDEDTMVLHHQFHHQGYVDKLNEAIEQTHMKGQDISIEELLSRIFTLIGHVSQANVIRDQGGGFVNHNMWFEQLTPGGSEKPKGALMSAIKKQFGGFDVFVDEMNDAAKERFGAGWAWLALNPQGKLVIYSTFNQDSPLMWEDVPLLGIDVWEHAYYKKYGPKRDEYLEAVWKIINWDVISSRYEFATKGLKKEKPMGFTVVVKSDGLESGETALTPVQRKKAKEQSFNRKEVGVGNAPYSHRQMQPNVRVLVEERKSKTAETNQ